MPVSVTMPQLGESVTEGTVTRWLKQVGDRVEADEPLLEVSTDKVDTEIPSPASGTLVEIKVNEDDTADVGSELAVIAGDGEDAGAAGPSDQANDASPAETAPAASASAQAEPVQPESAAPEPVQPEPAQPEPPQAQPAPADPSDAGQPSAEQEPGTEQPASSAPVAGSSGGTVVTMPALGESVTEGTVTRWLKQVGDSVDADEPLLEVSTDKVDTEIPSPAAGTLVEIKVPEDETVAVGAELAVIGSAGAASSVPAAEQPAPDQATAPAQPAPAPRSAPPVVEASPPAAPQPAAPPPAPGQPAAPQQPAAATPPAAAPAAPRQRRQWRRPPMARPGATRMPLT